MVKREYIHVEGGRGGVACALYRSDGRHIITTATMDTRVDADKRADELLEAMSVM